MHAELENISIISIKTHNLKILLALHTFILLLHEMCSNIWLLRNNKLMIDCHLNILVFQALAWHS